MQLLECVPNFSEGRDAAAVQAIVDAMAAVSGVVVLDVDPGKATNRTVVTLVGPPDAVVEAAFRGASRSAALIDMRQHRGEHPRFGALDVCPLVPVRGVTMERTVELARALAARLGEELGLSVYLYESAASSPSRKNLADVRAGEYEGLEARLAKDPPDFGPRTFQPKTGATAVGARDFLVAYNVNLNTTSTRRANAIAFDVREKGREKLDLVTMKPLRDGNGEAIWERGSLDAVKGIGWFIPEYGVAQVSLNLTDISVTPLHVAFDEVCKKADARGVRVTGSELVGLVPMRAMLDAGRYFLRKQRRSVGVSDAELIKIAVKSLGLSDLHPFVPEEKIIELAIAKKLGESPARLVGMTVRAFTEETASESPAPGGGSIAAAVGAFGAALGTMVANLSSHKRGWDLRWEEFSGFADRGKQLYERLLSLVDEDTAAFDRVMAAMALPRATEPEKAERKRAIQQATVDAAEVPLEVMRTALESFDVLDAMARIGNPASASDAGVGALCARTAVLGAELNVRINCASLEDRALAGRLVAEARSLAERAVARETELLAVVDSKIDG
jgi:glutamate formiminotransferase / formiminotetrahydrofolate cyclodeaminase